MKRQSYFLRILAISSLCFLLTACDEEHPDNKPGAVNNQYPQVSIEASAEVRQAAAGETNLHTLQIELSRAAPSDGFVRVQTANGSAQAGRHFTAVQKDVPFAKGARTFTTDIEVLSGEGETNVVSFDILIVSGSNVDLDASSALKQQVTITPREPTQDNTENLVLQLPDELSFRAPRANRESIDYPVVFALNAPAQVKSSVTIQSVEDTAEANVNFVPLNETVEVEVGSQEIAFTLTALHDSNQTENLKFELIAANAEGIDLPSERAIPVTLVSSNDEFSAPTLALPLLSELHEPANGTREYHLLLPFSGPALQAGSLQVRSQELTASAGVHFVAFDNTISFDAGATEVFLPITVNNVAGDFNDSVELLVQLSQPVNIQFPASQEFNLTIVPSSETIPTPELQLPTVIEVPEPFASDGSVEYEFWLPLSQPAREDGSVLVRTFDGSAIQGTNYTAIDNRRIEFISGDDHLRLSFEALHEGGLLEPKELQVQFSNADNVILPAIRSFTVVINSINVALPEVQIESEIELVRPPSGTNVYITVVLPLSSAAILRGEIALALNQGGALLARDIANVPDNVEFARGDMEAIFTFLLIGGNTTVDRTFDIVLSEASNAVLPNSLEERTISFTIVAPE